MFRRNALLLATSQAIALACGLLTQVVVVRAAGVDGKGALTTAVLIPTMIAMVMQAGLNTAIALLVGGRTVSVEHMAAVAGWFALVVGLPSQGLYLLALPLILASVAGVAGTTAVALASLIIPVQIWLIYLSSLLVARQDGVRAALLTTVQFASQLMLTLILVPRTGQATTAAMGATVGGMLLAAGAGTAWIAGPGRLLPAYDGPLLRRALRLGLPANAGTLLQFLNYRLDTLLVGAILGAGPTGQYAIAVALCEILWYLPSAVHTLLLPRTAGSDDHERRRFTALALRSTMAVLLAGGAGLAVAAPVLVPALFGADFAPSVAAIHTLLPGVVLVGLTKVLAADLIGRGHTGAGLRIALAGLALTVPLDLLLIPRWGITGAALASTTAYTVSTALAVWLYARAVRPGR